EMLQGETRDRVMQAARYVCTDIAPHLLQTTLEVENTVNALNGQYVDPCPSGAPTSGGADLLPTGRNFYSVDPRTLPTKVAWRIGQEMAENVIRQFIEEEGRYPESVGIILWATSNLRNHGTCVAEFLALMGMRPVWQEGISQRVIGLEVIPLHELKRPRVDVTGRISGLFRDSMPASVTWLDDAVKMVVDLDEPLDQNFVKKHVLEEKETLEAEGVDPVKALRMASLRIFGDPPGAHGAGVNAVLEAKNWENVDDIAAVYTRWGGHAYGEDMEGTYLPEQFKKRMSQIDITVQNVDHRESSMLSSDDYNSYRGGMVAAVRSYKGSMPRNYVNDSSDKSKLQLRTLEEELKCWFRGEAMNPKYIEGMMKHGYKG
ncbi:MAG: cobaltochelatase subunit CobN, partial [Eubacteriales bacterium]|nr:cobaltochelatase subunit CobN [Eubacteriales bacterium]